MSLIAIESNWLSESSMIKTASWIVSALLLTACSGGEAPTSTHEYALQGLYSASLSPQGDYAAIGSIQHGGSLWDTKNNERLFNWNHQQGEFSSLVASAFSPEQSFAITADQQTMVLWNVADGTPVWFWNAPARILDIKLTSEGRSALLGLDNHQAVYFDVQRGGILHTLHHQARVGSLDTSADGRFALTGTDDERATYWDVDADKALYVMKHENRVNTVALSPNGDVAFSAGELEQAKLWSTQTGEVLHVLTGDERFIQKRLSYTAAVFSTNSDQLLTGNSQGEVQLWDVGLGTVLKTWSLKRKDPLRPTSVFVLALGFTDQGYRAIASNGYINELK